MDMRKLPAVLKSRTSAEFVGAVILVVGTGLVFARVVNASNLKKADLDVKVGKISLKMNVEKDVTSMKAFLDKVFNDKEASREARALLAEFYGEYSPQDKKFVEAVANLSPKEPVSGELKTLCHRQVGPFKEELQDVRISFPINPGFADREAVVCSGSPLFDRRIVLYDKDEARSIPLTANHSRPCAPLRDDQLENIQITKNAARSLFGNRPVGKYEQGLVGLSN